jgi:hypothetical protein
VRLSPRDPNLGLMYLRIGEVHLLQSHADEAITWLEKARKANPEYSFVRVSLVSAYGFKGEIKLAAAELAAALRLSGNGSPATIARERCYVLGGFGSYLGPLSPAPPGPCCGTFCGTARGHRPRQGGAPAMGERRPPSARPAGYLSRPHLDELRNEAGTGRRTLWVAVDGIDRNIKRPS